MEGFTMEIKITRAAALKEKPDSSKLVFGKNMTDHMFVVDYDCLLYTSPAY